ncbi:MAG: class I SAM-dependent methyltransferase [Kineosporiaceae bacterium]
MNRVPYFGPDLARVHHEGYAFHADRCAPGILHLLESVRAAGGAVLELGAGSGHLTRHLLAAGHRVIATDASPAMLDVLDLLGREFAGDRSTGHLEVAPLVLPTDPVPACDAVVSVGHVLSYLDTEADVRGALVSSAEALRPGGVLAVDLCAPDYFEAQDLTVARSRSGDGWLLVVTYSSPDPGRFVRHITTFVRQGDDLWRRDDEDHTNVLVDPAPLLDLLARHGVAAAVAHGFGDEVLPPGLVTVVGRKAP